MQKFLFGLILVSFQHLTSQAQLSAFVPDHHWIADQEMKSALGSLAVQQSSADFSNASNNFDITYLDCKWTVDPAVRFIHGDVTIQFRLTEKTDAVTLDLSNQLQTDSILVNGIRVVQNPRPLNNSCVISLGKMMDAGSIVTTEIFYKGIPPVGTPINAFSNSAHAGIPVMWTLSEPYGGRDWWPCKNGLKDKADSIDIHITTPITYRSSANGLLAGEDSTATTRTTHWKHRYPIATYLVAFAVTNYRVIRDEVVLDNIRMPLMDHAYPERAAEFLTAAAITKRTLQLLNRTFGTYPFVKERYGHTQFGFGGGMEHQTNSFMQNMSESLIVHEAAHQWFGDKITCGSWKDIWLNEGFATYCTNLNTEKHYPVSTLMANYKVQLRQITLRSNGSVYVDDTTSVSRIFDSRLSYTKGGWVLRMLQWKLGDEVFFRAIRNYLNDPLLVYGYAKTADLKRHFEEASQQDLSGFFNDWVYGQGYPTYGLTWSGIGNTIQTVLSQTTSDPSVPFFEMPVPVRFKNNTRDTIIIIQHGKNQQVDLFRLGFKPDSAFIDPNLQLISGSNTVNKTDLLPNTANGTIYPNPVTGDQFRILLRGMGKGKLQMGLYDMQGKRIWEKTDDQFTGEDLIEINKGNLPKGIYQLWIRTEGEKGFVKRIIL